MTQAGHHRGDVVDGDVGANRSSSLGLAVLSTLAANTTSSTLSALGHAPAVTERMAALVSGFHVAFLVGAFLMLGGAAILAATVRRGDVSSIDTAVEPALAA